MSRLLLSSVMLLLGLLCVFKVIAFHVCCWGMLVVVMGGPESFGIAFLGSVVGGYFCFFERGAREVSLGARCSDG